MNRVLIPGVVCLWVLFVPSRNGLVFAAQAQWPGQRLDGSVLLPNQWSLRPVGRQIPLGDFPTSMAVHPSGRYVAVLHCGYGKHEVVVLNLRTGAVASR